MKSLTFMLIAGEPSGDLLAAELVRQLREEFARRTTAAAKGGVFRQGFAPRFYGAGGPKMAEAGVDLALDLTAHAVVGLVDVLKNYRHFRRFFRQLVDLAFVRQPDAIICVDFSGFNRRFTRAVRTRLARQSKLFNNWRPRIIQYVSPQVWASRPGRALQMAADLDLVLSIFPFEKEWFGRRVPRLRVEYVGHPVIDRYAKTASALSEPGAPARPAADEDSGASGPAPPAAKTLPLVVLLPGSRVSELKHHLPVMLKTVGLIGADWPSVRFQMVLPNEGLARLTLQIAGTVARRPIEQTGPGVPASVSIDLGRWGVRTIEVAYGRLSAALQKATVAIASTGTVTMECAYFGMPTVALYKTVWSNYQIGKHLILVSFLAMPNLLAGQSIIPEFIQHDATPHNLARETLDLLENPDRREQIRGQLANVIASLGPPGAGSRAARAIWDLFAR